MSSQNLFLDQRMKGKESFPYTVPWRDSFVRWAKVGLLSACAVGSVLPVDKALAACSGTQGNLAVSPTSLDFGTVDVGSSNPLTLTVSNTGCASLSVGTLTNNSSVFKLQSTTCSTTIAAGGSCAINFAFIPTVAATVTNTYTLTTSANSVGVPLKGVGKVSTTTVSTTTQTQQSDAHIYVASQQVKIFSTTPYVRDRLIVKLKTQPTQTFSASSTGNKELDALMQKFTVQEVVSLSKMPISASSGTDLGISKIYLLKLPQNSDVEQATKEFSANSSVEYAEPDFLVQASTNDPYFVNQWHLSNTGQATGTAGADIKAVAGWNVIATLNPNMSGQRLAIIDTGVNLIHPDLAPNIVAGYDVINNDSDPSDDNGHGSHAAGLAAAVTNNSVGIAGVCGSCRIMPVKVLDAQGSGSGFGVAQGIIWAVQNNATIINLSMGSPDDSQTIHDAIRLAYNSGIPIIAATGNDSPNPINYPARYSETIAVGSVDNRGNRAEDSNYGAEIDVVAPGGGYVMSSTQWIFSTFWRMNDSQAYAYSRGTSMATPQVTGAIGTLKSLCPTISPDQIRTRLMNTADDLGTAGFDNEYGAGRLNLEKLLKAAVANISIDVASPYNFGNVNVGSSSTPKRYTITNTGGGCQGLQISSITLTGTNNAEFSLRNNTCPVTPATLASNATCSFEVAFSPTSAGAKTATVAISSNANNTPALAMLLTGNGLALLPNIGVTPTTNFNFGNVNVGATSTTQAFTVSNTGNANLSIQQLTWGAANGGFSFVSNGCSSVTLAPNGTCSFSIRFQPTTAGAKSGSLSIPSNDPDTSNLTVTVTGNGIALIPNIGVTPNPYNFSNVNVGADSTKAITISNTGNANLSLGTMSWTSANGEFTLDTGNVCPLTLAPGGTCSFSIRFQPTTAGAKSGNLSIPSNDPDTSTLTVTVTGNGVVPSLSCNSPSTGGALTPTIRSVRNGSWTDVNTWDVGNRYPNLSSDVVLVNNHTITNLPATITINTLCNHGTLSSKTDSSLEIQAKGGIYNYAEGTIKGEDGVNDSTSSACNAGKDVTLKATESLQSEDKYGDLWYYTLIGSPSPIVNQGKILGGTGKNGTSCGGKGGNVIVLGRGITNNSNAEIKGGKGGVASAGKGGDGGRTEVFGQLGGNKDGLRDSTGFVNSQGSIVGGNGGNGTAGGRGGNLWIVAYPNVNLGPSLTNTNGCLQCSNSTVNRLGHTAGTGGSPSGGSGWVQIEPSVISITAGDQAEINGSDVTIFGGDDWTLDLSSANGTVIEATGNITLAVGNNSVVDLRGNSSTILKAGGEVKIFSDQVLLDPGVTLSEVIEAPKITPAPSKILGSVTLSGSSQIAGQPGVTLPIRFTISNGGPEADTYQVVTSNSTGWSSETAVEVQALDSLDVELGVKLPSNVGDAKVITIVATSLTDPEVTTTMEVRAVVTADGDEGDANLVGSGDTTTDSDNATVTTGDNSDAGTGDSGGNTDTTGNTDVTTFGNNQGGTAGNYVASGVANAKTGTPLSGATVKVVKMDNSQVTQTTTTDANGQWKVTGLPAGNYTATVSAPGYNSVVQQFEVSDSNSEAKVIIPPPRPLLTLNMTSSSSTLARPEEKVTYTLTVTNTGTVTATGVALQLTLPTGLTLDQLNGDTCDASQLSCTLPNLTPGAKAKVTLVVIAGSEGGKFDLTATLTSNDYPSEVNMATLELLPYLSVTPNCVPTKDVPMLGDWQCEWTVELSPDAPETVAKDVQVTLTIPQGVTVSSATADVGTVTPQTAKVLWTLQDLSLTGVNRATLKMAMKLTDMFLLALTQEAKVTATNYPAQTARARTAIFIDDSIKVDLALVVDITGSMQGEIDGVKAALKQFIATIDASQSPTVALIVFKDVVTVKAFTKDLNALLKVVDTLKAEGGGTCPEASVEALAKSARHVKEGGQIWFTTDASPYPDADIPSVLDLLKSQNIRFNATVTGDCGDVNSLNE